MLQKGIPLIKNTTSQKWHPTWMASYNYIIGFLKYCQFSTLLIESTPTIRHIQESNKNITLEWKKLDFKNQWPWVWIIQQISEFPFKNHLAQSLANITFRHFFVRCVIFLKHHFLWVLYLSISGGVFLMCHFCKVSLLSNGIKGCHFCWVYLMVV